jgi:hypothetical protein
VEICFLSPLMMTTFTAGQVDVWITGPVLLSPPTTFILQGKCCNPRGVVSQWELAWATRSPLLLGRSFGLGGLGSEGDTWTSASLPSSAPHQAPPTITSVPSNPIWSEMFPLCLSWARQRHYLFPSQLPSLGLVDLIIKINKGA